MAAPRLADIAPELISDLERLLIEDEEPDLVTQLSELRIIDRCRCGDEFCASFYSAPKPDGPRGPDHRTVALVPKTGLINLDVVGTDIVFIEVLYRDDLKTTILGAVP